MIAVTGARGFIASNLVRKLNSEGHHNLILVDELENKAKDHNLDGTKFSMLVHRDNFLEWLKSNASEVSFVFHLGARTDTTETDKAIFDKLNLNYSKEIFSICAKHHIPLIYASSAATYGNGELGYDDEAPIENLQPLNEYGWSKHHFDLWVNEQSLRPPFYAGLKFFNVYGPGENHKGRMASVIYHAYHQILKTGGMKLFQSHHPEYKDGEQMRDFIMVDDVANICYFLYKTRPENGLYNTGTGIARSFNDLVSAVFNSMQLSPKITYIPTPEDIRDKYQYFTQATTQKLQKAGYTTPYCKLEEGVKKYVQWLLENK